MRHVNKKTKPQHQQNILHIFWIILYYSILLRTICGTLSIIALPGYID